MARKSAPQAQLIRLRHVQTGAVIERYPVDARGMLLSGEYVSADTPAVMRLDGKPLERGLDGLVAGEPLDLAVEERAKLPPLAPADPTAPNVLGAADTAKAPSLADQLEAWELKDLHKLAARLDVDPAEKSRAELIQEFLATDLPGLVSAGVVSLEQLPELKITPEQFPNAAPAE